MAALTYSSSDVTINASDSGSYTDARIAEVNVTAGQVVEQSPTDSSKVVPGDPTTDKIPYIALTDASAGQIVLVLVRGRVEYGVVGQQGKPYYAGTGGSLVENADLSSGDYVKYLGHFIDDKTLLFSPEVITTVP